MTRMAHASGVEKHTGYRQEINVHQRLAWLLVQAEALALIDAVNERRWVNHQGQVGERVHSAGTHCGHVIRRDLHNLHRRGWKLW